ncbi:MAG: hypothetical protein M3122_01075 [Actinomycetota bacterium]|nr:hypothetical protein [Actinomycetota bacterium]
MRSDCSSTLVALLQAFSGSSEPQLFSIGACPATAVRGVLSSWLASAAKRRWRSSVSSWYATKDLMVLIEGMGKKRYYCPLKSNRQVDEPGGEHPYRRVDALEWSERELKRGKLIKTKGFPKKEHKVRLVRVAVHSRRASLEWLDNNDPARNSVQEARKAQPCAERSRSFTGRPSS